MVAAWLRRRQQLVGVLLVRRGGSSVQVTGVTLLQAVPSVILGVLVGTGVAAFLVALRAPGFATGTGLAAAAAAVGSAVPVLVALAVLAVVGVTAVVRWPATGGEAARYVTWFALVASALLPFLVSAAGRGPSASGSAIPGGAHRLRVRCRSSRRRFGGGCRVAGRPGLALSGHDRPPYPRAF